MLSDMERVLEDSARGGFFLTLGNLISTIILAISVFIVARILGSELYGLYSVSTVIPMLLLLFANPGINQGIIKYSASLRAKGGKDRVGTLLLHGLAFEALLGLAAFAVCFIFSEQFAVHILNRPEVALYIQLASALIVFQAIFATVNSAFVGSDKTEYNTLTTTVQATVKAIIAPLLVIIGLSITGALTGYVLSSLIASLLGIYLFIFKIYRPLNHSNNTSVRISDNLRTLIRYGFPLYLSALMAGFALQYQNILLAVFTSNYEIGNFKAAMNFTVLVTALAVPIATTLLPAFSKIESNEKHVKDFFKMAIKYTSMVILPVATILILYAKEIIQIVYGEGYELASTFLSIYAMQFFLVGLGSIVLGSLFNGLGETKINLKIALVNSIIIIVLAPILTWLLKINGMIITVIFASLTSTLYAIKIAKSKFKLELNTETTAKIYAVSIMSIVPVLLFQKIPLTSSLIHVILGTAIYLTTYLLLIPMAKIITLGELAEMKTVTGKIKPLRYVAQPIFYLEEKILSRIAQRHYE